MLNVRGKKSESETSPDDFIHSDESLNFIASCKKFIIEGFFNMLIMRSCHNLMKV